MPRFGLAVRAVGLFGPTGIICLAIIICLAGRLPADDALVREGFGVLEANCLRCHGKGNLKGGLDLTNREAALKGGKRGPAVVPGKPDESRLVLVVTREAEPHMPPRKTLPPEAVDTLRRWVAAGPAWPADAVAAKGAAKPQPQADAGAARADAPAEPTAAATAEKVSAGPASAYWWHAPVERPPLPPVKDTSWGRNAVDAFVLARLEADGFAPSPQAGKGELLRRATFDLLGLPPTPEEAEQFFADDAPDAYERLIRRLLASPRYGERWGRHWLDLVRFAETNGYERDGPKAHAWRYRDYVIRSFNEDKPYDQFVREQLAGDEIDDPTADSLVATGYYRLGSWDDEPDDKAQARFDELDDVIRTTGSAFLGLTVSCARCHDHKFDAIPQVDYYRLLSFFAGIQHSDEVPLVPPHEVEAYKTAIAAADAKVKEIEKRIAALEEPTRARLREAKLAALPADLREAYALAGLAEVAGEKRSDAQKRRAEEASKKSAPSAEEVQKELPAEARTRIAEERASIEATNRARPAKYPVAMGIVEQGANPPKTHLLVRGNARQPGAEVAPGFPTLLASMPARPAYSAQAGGRAAADAKPKTSGRRRMLADWLTDPAHPLTSRVMANRVFQFHFGRGIVRSPSDFGMLGDQPTHPELLDWLSAELVASGWRLKPLHYLLMTSSTYRMSCQPGPRGMDADPQNDLLGRMDLRRLEAECLRDSILAVTGRLNLQAGGPSCFPAISKEVLHGQSRPGDGWNTSTPTDAARRSVYVFVKRSLLLPLLEAFDFADTGQTCPRRNTTTIAPQALTLLNGDFMQEQSKLFAERLLREAGPEPARQVERAYRLAIARAPSAAEMQTALEFLDRQRALIAKGAAGAAPDPAETARRALDLFCLLILNLNEFLYLD